jgi:hypothetical protein
MELKSLLGKVMIILSTTLKEVLFIVSLVNAKEVTNEKQN